MKQSKWLTMALGGLSLCLIIFGYGGTCSKSSSSKDTASGSSGTNLPTRVANPSPADVATNVVTTTQISWAVASNATSYDVYFGTANPPPSVATTTNTSYNPGALAYTTTYYWQIDSRNTVGTTTGTTWSFQTIGPPPTVTAISPAGYTDLNTTVQITGTNFQSGAALKIGATTITTTTVVNASTISATIYYGLSAGSYNVKVTNPDTQNATLTNGFTVNNPPAEWTKETLNITSVTSPLSSTCTRFEGGQYRMYFGAPGGIWSISSSNGITWSNTATSTGIVNAGAGSPAVIKLQSGTYLMIYEIQQMPGPTSRLYRATSNDGITFTNIPGPLTGGAVLIADAGENDFVSVPDILYITSTNRLRMYFVASTSASWTHTAYSDDDGLNWTREGKVTITGGPIGGQVNDPDVITTTTTGYRLFFTTPPAGQSIGNLRMRSAVSTDGRNFTLESGSVVTPSGSVTVIMDPDAILINGTSQYRIYYGGVIGVSTPDVLRAIISP